MSKVLIPLGIITAVRTAMIVRAVLLIRLKIQSLTTLEINHLSTILLTMIISFVNITTMESVTSASIEMTSDIGSTVVTPPSTITSTATTPTVGNT